MFHKQVKLLNFPLVYMYVTDTANINNQLYEKMVSNTFYFNFMRSTFSSSKER